MTDREKEIEIAKRLGWTARYFELTRFTLINPQGKAVSATACPESAAWDYLCPCYLTDRNAAQEIVTHFADSDDWHQFSEAIHWAWTLAKKPVKASSFIFVGLLATSREICEAACEVWEIQ